MKNYDMNTQEKWKFRPQQI